jgi:hypothetical protein
VTRAIRAANAMMFRGLDTVITIGRDSEPLLLRYKGLPPDKLRFIPNWATLAPGIRPIEPSNPFRRATPGRFVVGLSGNLGFTHDPLIVFEAARSLRDEAQIHFLLSGWGLGFETLKQLQAEARLPNVTLVERVADDELEQFLSQISSGSSPTGRTSLVYRFPVASIICLRRAGRSFWFPSRGRRLPWLSRRMIWVGW